MPLNLKGSKLGSKTMHTTTTTILGTFNKIAQYNITKIPGTTMTISKMLKTVNKKKKVTSNKVKLLHKPPPPLPMLQ